MYQYGVLKYVPSRNVFNICSTKECSLINVPQRSVQIHVPIWSVEIRCPIKECELIDVPLRNVYCEYKRKRLLPAARFELGTFCVPGQDHTTEPSSLL